MHYNGFNIFFHEFYEAVFKSSRPDQEDDDDLEP